MQLQHAFSVSAYINTIVRGHAQFLQICLIFKYYPVTFCSCRIFQTMLQIFSRDLKQCRQIVFLHSDLLSEVSFFLVVSFRVEVAAAVIVARKGDRTQVCFIIALFGVFAGGLERAFSKHNFKRYNLKESS